VADVLDREEHPAAVAEGLAHVFDGLPPEWIMSPPVALACSRRELPLMGKNSNPRSRTNAAKSACEAIRTWWPAALSPRPRAT
jgi:hypothetical protein